MTRNSQRPKKSSEKLLYVAPILAVIIIGLILYGAYANTYRVAVNSRAYLEIGIVNGNGYVRHVIPDQSIGVPGGFMSTTKYLSDGFNGNYPLYSSPYNCNNSTGTTICAISIYSKVARRYTLQDFFDVWGVPLGPSQTLSTTYTSNSTSGGDYLWTMCTSPLSNGAAPSGGWTITNDWGSHVLTGNEVILLDFSDPNYTCNS